MIAEKHINATEIKHRRPGFLISCDEPRLGREILQGSEISLSQHQSQEPEHEKDCRLHIIAIKNP